MVVCIACGSVHVRPCLSAQERAGRVFDARNPAPRSYDLVPGSSLTTIAHWRLRREAFVSGDREYQAMVDSLG